MKKANAQFAAVFVGVLLLHLAAATALMRSAKTEGPSHSAASVDPYYHSSPEESAPPPASPVDGRQDPSGNSESTRDTIDPENALPDAFAAGSDSADSQIAPPPVPASAVTATQPRNQLKPVSKVTAPAPNSATRRLTVTQLLAPDPPQNREDRPDKAAADSTGPTTLKIKPLPADSSGSGLRKIRSLSGN